MSAKVRSVFRPELTESEELRIWRRLEKGFDPLIRSWLEFLREKTQT